jgi:hypothetical protein
VTCSFVALVVGHTTHSDTSGRIRLEQVSFPSTRGRSRSLARPNSTR